MKATARSWRLYYEMFYNRGKKRRKFMKILEARKFSRVCCLFLVIVLAMFLGGCGSSQSSPEWNISGVWSTFYATAGTPGQQGPNPFTFSTSENTVTGTTSQGQPIAGSITGLDLSFSFVDSDGATSTSNGTVSAADGSTMSGTWTKSNGQSGTWYAVINLPPLVSAEGNWNVFQATSGVAGEQGPDVFAFTQSGYGIAGETPQGQQITGAIGRLDIIFFWVDGDEVTHTFIGVITADGTGMSGTWSDTSGKSGTWRAAKS
jgi:hypothetical protein